MKTIGLYIFFTLFLYSASYSTHDATAHVGEYATVCGKVYGGYYAVRSKGKPTFINLDGHYPQQRFTVLIWKEQRHLFYAPERQWIDKRLCVTGLIEIYREIPQIVIYEKNQINIVK